MECKWYTYDMKVDLPTPESPSSSMGTTGASLIGVMASRSVAAEGAVAARTPSALIAAIVMFCFACRCVRSRSTLSPLRETKSRDALATMSRRVPAGVLLETTGTCSR